MGSIVDANQLHLRPPSASLKNLKNANDRLRSILVRLVIRQRRANLKRAKNSES